MEMFKLQKVASLTWQLTTILKEIGRDYMLGVYHSILGFQKWWNYDGRSLCTSPASASSQVTGPASASSQLTGPASASSQVTGPASASSQITGPPSASSQPLQPLTTLGARRRSSSSALQVTAAATAASNSGTPMKSLFKSPRHVLAFMLGVNITLFFNYYLIHALTLWISRYSDAVYISRGIVLIFLLDCTNFVCKPIITGVCNFALQSDFSEKIYTDLMGRAKPYGGYAERVSELYTIFQLQVVYSLITNLLHHSLVYFLGPLGTVIAFQFKSIYWTLYLFDFCWYYKAFTHPQKIYFIQRNWAYSLGFGTIMSCDVLVHPFYGAIMHCMLLPFFILSSMEAWKLGANGRPFPGFQIPFFAFPWLLSDRIHKFFMDYYSCVSRLIGRVFFGDNSRSICSEDDSSSRPCTPSDTSRASSTCFSGTCKKMQSLNSYKKKNANTPTSAAVSDSIDKRVQEMAQLSATRRYSSNDATRWQLEKNLPSPPGSSVRRHGNVHGSALNAVDRSHHHSNASVIIRAPNTPSRQMINVARWIEGSPEARSSTNWAERGEPGPSVGVRNRSYASSGIRQTDSMHSAAQPSPLRAGAAAASIIAASKRNSRCN